MATREPSATREGVESVIGGVETETGLLLIKGAQISPAHYAVLL